MKTNKIKITETQLIGLIRETCEHVIREQEFDKKLNECISKSIKKVLNERNYSFTQHGYYTFEPYAYCDDEQEIILRKLGFKEEYNLKFEREVVHEDMVMYYSDGSGYPGYDGSDYFELVDDDNLYQDLEKLKSVDETLYDFISEMIDKIKEDDVDWVGPDYPEYDD